MLRTPVSEDAVRKLLPYLDLTISAHATNAVPDGAGNSAAASGKHDIASTKTLATDNVELVSLGEHSYVVWKPVLHLVRPRIRLQRPAVYFTANVNVNGSPATVTSTTKTQYLPSFEPLPANVLESLHHDPSLGASGRQIHVSENRVTKVSPPSSQLEDLARPMRGATKRAFPTVPAFFMRMGYSAMADSVIASLHVEISPLVTGFLKIDDVRFEIQGMDVESLNEAVWPQRSHAGDEVVLLYRIDKSAPAAASPTKTMDLAMITMKATASFDENSRVEIETQWQTQVDMSHSTKTMPYKWSRPLSAGYGAHRRVASQSSSSRPSMHDISQMSSKEGEIIFTFTAPPTTKQNSDVTIQVQCVNRSNRTRKFALVTAQRRRSSTTIKPRFEKRLSSNDTAVTASTHHSNLQETTGQKVLTLTPDVRIGPLTAGACFETTLKYRTTSAGVLDFGTIRLIDLESRQTLDIAELPDVISLEQ